MTDLVVIVPSRGRPEAAYELSRTFEETCTADTVLLVAVDDDDPQRDDYLGSVKQPGSTVLRQETHSMVESLNRAARFLLNEAGAEIPLRAPVTSPFAVGFMGDDHRPRTKGWDQAYLGALRDLGTGIVYGNDLLQGPNLPTQCAMTADIIRTIGHMAPPTLRHMYVDNYWMLLGHHAGCLRYLPDVVVEHMHPVAGKAEWTEGHRRVNAQSVYAADAQAFEAYVRARMGEDVAAVKALRS